MRAASALLLATVIGMGAASAQEIAEKHVKGWLQPLPFDAIGTVGLELPGFPNMAGVCVGGGYRELRFEGCVGTILLLSSAHFDAKFLLYHSDLAVAQERDGRTSYRGPLQGFGVLGGVRYLANTLSAGGKSTRPEPAPSFGGGKVGADLGLSYEALSWNATGLPLRIALDGGVCFFGMPFDVGSTWLPFIELKFGVAL